VRFALVFEPGRGAAVDGRAAFVGGFLANRGPYENTNWTSDGTNHSSIRKRTS
jgi:hypothetical protein